MHCVGLVLNDEFCNDSKLLNETSTNDTEIRPDNAVSNNKKPSIIANRSPSPLVLVLSRVLILIVICQSLEVISLPCEVFRVCVCVFPHLSFPGKKSHPFAGRILYCTA